MPVALSIALDARNLAKFRRLMAANQKVAAQSLTFTAERAKPAWIVGQSVFHKRNTWIDRGVRMRAATPGNLNAQVGTLDKFMGRHIVGADEDKEGNLFIPFYQRIGEALTHTKERRALARMQETKRKPFWITGRDGGRYLVRRAGKRSFPLIVLGKLQAGAKIPDRLDAVAIVDGVVQREFPTVYERLLLKWAETS
jgi:hypothetical protein